MITGYKIRKATLDDTNFLITTIISAEKSGTDNLGLANIFNLTESELIGYLRQMLEEEIDGCELSVSSFYVADINGRTVAAVGGWLEGGLDGTPSALLKSNLIGFTLPSTNIAYSVSASGIARGIQIGREMGLYQIEYVYTLPEYRGHNLVQNLINRHLSQAKKYYPECKKVQTHVFANNLPAIRMYEKNGFRTVRRYESEDVRTAEYFPCNVQLLMERDI